MSTDSSPSIEISTGVEIGYKETLAKFSDSVELRGGTHYLIARNGRGKTTLLRTLARSIKPLAGTFKTKGFMQYLPEDMRFDNEITPSVIFRMLLPKDRLQAAMDLAKSIELDTKKPYGQLSTGNRRKTSLITAEFSVKPDTGNILLLDEPFSGLDAFARAAFEDIWKKSHGNVLRLVSCHPDYDSMAMPSALMIEGQTARHLQGDGQTWNKLKTLLH